MILHARKVISVILSIPIITVYTAVPLNVFNGEHRSILKGMVEMFKNMVNSIAINSNQFGLPYRTSYLGISTSGIFNKRRHNYMYR